MADRVYKRELADGTIKWDGIVHIPDPVTGKRKQVQKTFTTQKQAKKWVADQQGAINNGTAVVPSGMTVAEMMAYWLEHYVRHQKSGKTYVSYEGTVRLHIVPLLGKIKLQKLTAARLQQFCTEKIDAGSSARTVELCHLNISQALDQAVALGWVARNVADVVKPPRWKARETETWSIDESTRFLSVADQSPYGPIWLLSLTKGLRKGELLGVRWQDLDLERGILRVRQTVGALHGKVVIRGTKTPKSRRDVDLRGGVLAALRAHKVRQNERRLVLGSAWQEGYDLVFTCANGGPIHPDNLDRDYDRWVKKAGVKRIRIHDLRHTYATVSLANGENPKVVSESMGHADVAFTMHTYQHVLPQQRRELADRMERLFLGDQEAVG